MHDEAQFPPRRFLAPDGIGAGGDLTQQADGDIVGHSKIEGDQVGRDKVTYHIQNQYVSAAASRLPYRRSISPLLTRYTEVFVGRETELGDLLDLAVRPEPGYLLIEGPAGYGKSALIASLIRRWETAQGIESVVPDFVYFFIRESRMNHTPAEFCLAVNSQLLDLLGLPGGVPSDLDGRRSQLLELWSMAVETAQANRPLLLLVDGLDEMSAGGVTIADVLPGELAPNVHVVVTSRPSPEALIQVPPEHPFRQASTMRLHALGLADIEELLCTYGTSKEHTTVLAQRVLEVTKGEPLLARFVGQDVARAGEHLLDALERNPPQGIKDYFQQQFKHFRTRIKGHVARQALGLLLVAHGPMGSEELAEALGVPVWDVNEALEPVRRFLLGRDRFELMHLEFRAVVGEQFGPTERQGYRRQLLDWCANWGARGWPDDTPDYVLDHYCSHLREAGDKEGLYRVVDRRWMKLKAARTHSHQAFAEDVLMAIEAAASESPPNLVQEIRGSAIYATLASMATNIPQETLLVLAEAEQLDRAMDFVRLIRDPEKRSSAYHRLGNWLWEHKRPEEALDAAEQSAAAALLSEDDSSRVRSLGDSIKLFAQLGQPNRADELANQALKFAQAIEIEAQGDSALSDISEVFAIAGLGDQALKAVQAVRNDSTRVSALATLAELFGQAARPESAMKAANEAIDAIETTDDASWKSGILLKIGMVWAKAGRLHPAVETAEQAVEAAEAVSPVWKVRILAEAGNLLAEAGQPGQAAEVLDNALAGAYALEEMSDRAIALIGITRELIQAKRFERAVEVANEAMRTIDAEEDAERSRLLAEIAMILVDARQLERAVEVAGDALASIRATMDGSYVDNELGYIARVLADGGDLERAVDVAREIENEWHRADTLADLSVTLVRAGQTNLATQIARSTENEWKRTETLASLAKVLAETGELALALELTEEILLAIQPLTTGWPRVDAFPAMAKALMEVGRLEKGAQVAKAIETQRSDAPALVASAGALSEAGQPDRAFEVAEKAILAADGIDDLQERCDTLNELIRILVKINRRDRAVELIRRIERIAPTVEAGAPRGNTLTRLGETLAAIGMPDKAIEVARVIENDWQKAGVLADIARALAETGQLDKVVEVGEQAAEIAYTLEVDIELHSVIIILVEALARAGQPEWAAELTQAISPFSHEHADALANIADIAADAGEPFRAVEAGGQALHATYLLESNLDRGSALGTIAKAFAKAGQLERAVDVAEYLVQDPIDYATALAAIAGIAAEAEEQEWAIKAAKEALRAVHMVGTNWRQPRVFSLIAIAYAKAGYLEDAVEIAERALAVARLLDRRLFMKILEQQVPLISSIDDGATLAAVGEALVEVEQWWQ
jgi:tetratricopeptide (TPR) repeat protein